MDSSMTIADYDDANEIASNEIKDALDDFLYLTNVRFLIISSREKDRFESILTLFEDCTCCQYNQLT